jgi:hypothetical protein
MEEPMIAFATSDREIRINFGVFAGREVTAAEIEELARELHQRVPQFEVVAENRYRFGAVEASVHQVRLEFEEPLDDELRGRILEIVERWTTQCAAERHADVITPLPGTIAAVQLP